MKKTRTIEYVYWFRKALRVHDNQGLAEAEKHKNLLNIFIIDPHYWEKSDIHENRLNFLLESLRDLDSNLRKKGSELTLICGTPKDVFKFLAP